RRLSTVDSLLIEKTAPIAVITINRPDHSNGLTDTLLADLTRIINELETDDTIGAVVLTGAGGHFSSGFDLKETRKSGPAENDNVAQQAHVREHADQLSETLWKIWHSPLPFVGAVERLCLGGAVYLAAMFDIVL